MERYINNEKETLALGDRLAHGVHHGAIIFISGETGSGKTTLMTGILHGLGVLVSKDRIGKAFINTLKSNNLTVHCFNFYGLSDHEDPNYSAALEHLNEKGTLRIVESPEHAHGELPEPDLHIKFRPGIKGRTVTINALTEQGSDIYQRINSRY